MNIFSTHEQHQQIRALKNASAITDADWSRLLKNHRVRREEDLAWKKPQWVIEELQNLRTKDFSTHPESRKKPDVEGTERRARLNAVRN